MQDSPLIRYRRYTPLYLLRFLVPFVVPYLALFWVLPSPVYGHPFSPTVLTLTEEETGAFRVDLVAPLGGSLTTPVFPAHCSFLHGLHSDNQSTTEWSSGLLSCGEKGIRGYALYLRGNGLSETLLTIHFRNGEVEHTTLHAESHTIPLLQQRETQGRGQIARQFFLLGVKHILSGADHVFFLVGLLLLLRSVSALLLTVSAFTVGHSVTLVLASLSLIHPPVLYVECLIALSVVFVAREVLRSSIDASAFRPAFTALLFGLFHGMGFASALSEISMPKTDLPLSLFCFNLGVEGGQLVVVGMCLFPARLLVRKGWTTLCGYALGGIASAWTIERTLALFGYGSQT